MIGHIVSSAWPGLLGALIGSHFSRRRIEGRMAERERGEWRSMTLRERGRVRRALRRGRAVDNPRHARVAAELAASLHTENRRNAMWSLVFVLVLFGAGAILAFAEGLEGLGLICLVAVAISAVLGALMPSRRRRLVSAEAANRSASAADLESPAPQPGGAQ